jgi:hypothetical protein
VVAVEGLRGVWSRPTGRKGGWAVRRPACPGFAWAGLRGGALVKGVNGVSLHRSPVGCHTPTPVVGSTMGPDLGL